MIDLKNIVTYLASVWWKWQCKWHFAECALQQVQTRTWGRRVLKI